MTMPESAKLILNTCTDPYFNLALEEFLLTESKDNFFMLWRNTKSVIVGLNQNTAAEVNAPFARENGVAVVRRLTGGGAVFHDEGNINYTFIENGTAHGNDYAYFSAPLIKALRRHGVNACLSGRNDLLAGGKKISGAAQCIKNGRVLHHGTLLYSADLNALSQALNVSALKIEGKGIKSVRSRVSNISELIEKPGTATRFMTALFDDIKTVTGGEIHTLTPDETAGANALANKKYRTDEWNYGKKSDFNLRYEKRLPSGCYNANLSVENGVIKKMRLYGDYFAQGDISVLEKAFAGVKYNYESIAAAAKKADVCAYLPDITPSVFAEILGV